jgi:hypothetical protein
MRVTAAFYLIGLMLWFAATVAPGAAAASVFMTVPRMEISVPALDSYFAQDSAEAGRFVAGRALQPLFEITDWIQMVAAAMVVSSGFRLWRLRGLAGPRWSATVMVALIAVAALLLGARLMQSNGMRADLAMYWQAVVDFDRAAALPAKARFDDAHRVAERLSSMQVATLLAVVAMAGVASVPPVVRTAKNP